MIIDVFFVLASNGNTVPSANLLEVCKGCKQTDQSDLSKVSSSMEGLLEKKQIKKRKKSTSSPDLMTTSTQHDAETSFSQFLNSHTKVNYEAYSNSIQNLQFSLHSDLSVFKLLNMSNKINK